MNTRMHPPSVLRAVSEEDRGDSALEPMRDDDIWSDDESMLEDEIMQVEEWPLQFNVQELQQWDMQGDEDMQELQWDMQSEEDWGDSSSDDGSYFSKPWGEEAFAHLCARLESNCDWTQTECEARQTNFSFCLVDSKISQLGAALRSNQYLEILHLDLDHVAGDVDPLLYFLQESPSLRDLTLHDGFAAASMHIQHARARLMDRVFLSAAKNEYIELELHLEGACVGAELRALLLSPNAGMKELSLSQCVFVDDAARSILNAFSQNKKLSKLGWSNTNTKTLERLLPVLSTHSTLKMLHLEDLNAPAFAALGRLLGNPVCYLSVLEVTLTFDSNLVECFVQSLQGNRSLRHVDIVDCTFQEVQSASNGLWDLRVHLINGILWSLPQLQRLECGLQSLSNSKFLHFRGRCLDVLQTSRGDKKRKTNSFHLLSSLLSKCASLEKQLSTALPTHLSIPSSPPDQGVSIAYYLIRSIPHILERCLPRLEEWSSSS